MNKRTIKQAAEKVLEEKSPLYIEEIYNRIIDLNLYNFGAQNPLAILAIEIKRSCEGFNYSKSCQNKLFRHLSDGKIELIDSK